LVVDIISATADVLCHRVSSLSWIVQFLCDITGFTWCKAKGVPMKLYTSRACLPVSKLWTLGEEYAHGVFLLNELVTLSILKMLSCDSAI